MLDVDADHFLGKIAQKALICKGNSVLIVRHTTSENVWELPGGRLNKDEDPKAGLQREINEELGVDIRVGKAILIEQFVMKRTDEAHLAVVYEAELVGEGDFTIAADEVAEVRWVTSETWKQYELFGMYAKALESHFESDPKLQ